VPCGARLRARARRGQRTHQRVRHVALAIEVARPSHRVQPRHSVRVAAAVDGLEEAEVAARGGVRQLRLPQHAAVALCQQAQAVQVALLAQLPQGRAVKLLKVGAAALCHGHAEALAAQLQQDGAGLLRPGDGAQVAARGSLAARQRQQQVGGCQAAHAVHALRQRHQARQQLQHLPRLARSCVRRQLVHVLGRLARAVVHLGGPVLQHKKGAHARVQQHRRRHARVGAVPGGHCVRQRRALFAHARALARGYSLAAFDHAPRENGLGLCSVSANGHFSGVARLRGAHLGCARHLGLGLLISEEIILV
jgi:hypothetical protein